jgi:peptidyl-prolyl cis-trans isomerase C
MNTTSSFRFAASVCLCAGLLAASGCSKPKADAVEQPPVDKSGVAGEFDATDRLDAPVPAVNPEKVLVSVDGENLTYGEADVMLRRMLASQGAPEEQMEALLSQMGSSMRERIVDQFVGSTLLKNEANARKIEITDAEVERALSNLTTRLPPDTDLASALESMGLTLEQVRKDIRDNERIRKLYEEETGKIPDATDAEIAAYYEENARQFTKGEEVEARHILIGARDVDDTQKVAAKAKAEGLRKQLLEGADFAALAAANSDCPSKADGGSLGSFGRGRMVPAFEQVAFTLATNVISEVVETPFGYHIIQVTGRTDGGKTSLEEAHGQLADQLSARKKNEVFETFIEGLRAKAKIVHDTPAEAPPAGDALQRLETAPVAPETPDAEPAPEAPVAAE